MLKDALSRMADVFLPGVLMHGQDLQQKGHVLSIRLSEGLLKARVKGGASQIYDIHIDLKNWPANPAHCNCQAKINCEHAAASLFALQVRENYDIPAPSRMKTKQSLNAWLASLRKKENVEAKTEHYDIIYLLEPQFTHYEHRILIRLAMAKRLKKGGLGKKAVFTTVTESRKQYFTPEDEAIISALSRKCDMPGLFDHLAIRNSDLLTKILLTKRAYLNQEQESLLELGEMLDAELNWRLASDGKQHLSLEAGGELVRSPLFLDQTWHFDSEINLFTPLKTAYAPGQLKSMLNTEPVEVENAAKAARELAESQPDLPAPKLYAQREKRQLRPQAIVRFDAIELDKPVLDQTLLYVFDLTFSYEGMLISPQDKTDKLLREENGVLIEFERAWFHEHEKQAELQQIIPYRSANISEKLSSAYDLSHERVLVHYKNATDLPRLYNQAIPLLKKKGWQVEFAHTAYEELIDADEVEWFSELDERGNDFFAYQLGILIDGKAVSIVPLIAELIGRIDKNTLETLPDKERLRLPLPKGKILHVELGRIKPLIRFLLQYGMRLLKQEGQLEISRYQLILMQETEQAMTAVSARWQGAEHLREQLSLLTTMSNLPVVALPEKLQATLRDYQHQGVNWLQFLRQARLGGVLADDMGLGKTVQTLAHLQLEKEQGRIARASLIVAPTSLVGNWYEEAKRFTPELRVLIFHGADRHNDDFDDYDLVISTYGLIQRDKTRFLDYPFYYLILDEAQSIKNARTKTTQIIQQLQAAHRLCLSGTPLENHLGELWSLFHFLMPGLLGDAKQFRQFFKTPIEKYADTERRELLARRVQPFMLRRTKNQVASELPAKTEMTRSIELSGSQRDLYEAIRMSMEKKVRDAIARQGLGKSHIVLLDALLKLRQVCCDPKLLSMPEADIAHGTSAKMDALMELLESLMDEGRRVLIFSQFTSMLKLIEEELISRNYDYLKLTGQTQNRQTLVNTFQEGKIPIFLISLKAGGTGLNLTKADTVIHYDPWWNPAVEDQATDRSHRIGQENPVFVYKLITAGTVEEAILAMQEKKRQLFDGILSDNANAMASLSTQDLEQFFMPLAEQ